MQPKYFINLLVRTHTSNKQSYTETQETHIVMLKNDEINCEKNNSVFTWFSAYYYTVL